MCARTRFVATKSARAYFFLVCARMFTDLYEKSVDNSITPRLADSMFDRWIKCLKIRKFSDIWPIFLFLEIIWTQVFQTPSRHPGHISDTFQMDWKPSRHHQDTFKTSSRHLREPHKKLKKFQTSDWYSKYDYFAESFQTLLWNLPDTLDSFQTPARHHSKTLQMPSWYGKTNCYFCFCCCCTIVVFIVA